MAPITGRQEKAPKLPTDDGRTRSTTIPRETYPFHQTLFIIHSTYKSERRESVIAGLGWDRNNRQVSLRGAGGAGSGYQCLYTLHPERACVLFIDAARIDSSCSQQITVKLKSLVHSIPQRNHSTHRYTPIHPPDARYSLCLPSPISPVQSVQSHQ